MTPIELSHAVNTALSEAVDDGTFSLLADLLPILVHVERPRQQEYGDWVTNVALRLARQAGTTPQLLAEDLAMRLGATAGIKEVKVAGPGFLNITLDAAAAGEIVRTIVEAGPAYGQGGALELMDKAMARLRDQVLTGQLVIVGETKLRGDTTLGFRELAEWIGEDAARYSLARYSADAPLLRCEDLIRQTKANPIFYVQYAHSRTVSRGRVAASRGVRRTDGFDPSRLSHSTEAALVGRLAEFPQRMNQAAELCEPYRVARYLESLASDFYSWSNGDEELHIVPFPDEVVMDEHRARLWLNDAVRTVLANGLDVLGVSAPERM